MRVADGRVDYRSYCTLGHVRMVEYETQDGCKFRPSTRKLSATQTLTHKSKMLVYRLFVELDLCNTSCISIRR